MSHFRGRPHSRSQGTERRLSRYLNVILFAAFGITIAAGRMAGSQFQATEKKLEEVSSRLVESEQQLDTAHADLEALFGEIVGNLEHKYIPLDRATRIPLRRGQVVCDRIARQASDPVRRASAYCTLGHIHYHLHDLQASTEAYRAALETVRSVGQSEEKVLILAYATNHLVHGLAALGYEDEALQLCQGIKNELESATPSSFALLDELGFAMRNLAVLLASQGALSESVAAAKAHLELLDALVAAKPNEDSLAERQVDSLYLLAGLRWRTAPSRGEALALLGKVASASAALRQKATQRMQSGEAMSSYARYKSEAVRAQRELAFAEQSLAFDSADVEGGRQPSFWTRKNLFRGRRSIGTELLLDDIRMPAEFEPQEAMILKWSGREWQDKSIVKLLKQLVGHVEIVLVVDDFEAEDEAKDALVRSGVSPSAVRFYQIPTNTLWVRDFGPLTVVGSEGFPIWIDYQHLHPDERNGNDLFAEHLGRLTGHRVIRGPLLLEGGNVITNGEGIVVCTQQLEDDNRKLGFTPQQFRHRMRCMLGCQQLVVLEPLKREGTGHVDWFLTFVSPTTVVIGQYDQSVDVENANILDRNAERLQRLRTTSGPLRVVRIPMPPHPASGFGGTYTNVVFANGKLIIPTWQNVSDDLNRQALHTFRKVLPDWDVVALDCSEMLANSGALHCATVNIPKMPAGKLPSSR